MITEYEKAIEFLKVGCGCSCSSKVPKEAFAEMREAFQALSKSVVLRRKFALIKGLYTVETAIHLLPENLLEHAGNWSSSL
jgi:hypothetical protein